MRQDDNELDDSEREIVAKLRALPPEGNEPDWRELEAAIRADVGDRAPTMWWRNWKWIVPIWALATTAAVALIVLRGHHDKAPVQQLTTATHQEQHVVPAPEQTHSTTTAPTMWLGGEVVDVDALDDQSLDDLDQAARDSMGSGDDVSLEDLDDAGLDQLEDWLEKNKS
jgi:hypothetical protein